MRLAAITIPLDQISDFCQNWEIQELSLFGSILREDFRPDSDIDVLVTFYPGVQVGLMALVKMEKDLSQRLKRSVDLVDRRDIEASDNWIRQHQILSTAQPIYAAK